MHQQQKSSLFILQRLTKPTVAVAASHSFLTFPSLNKKQDETEGTYFKLHKLINQYIKFSF